MYVHQVKRGSTQWYVDMTEKIDSTIKDAKRMILEDEVNRTLSSLERFVIAARNFVQYFRIKLPITQPKI